MRAILIGGTGLIGGLLLDKLLKDPVFSKIKLISRRTAGIQHPKLEEAIIRFDDAESFRKEVTATDVLFSCAGTTRQQVKGDLEAYRKIDFDIAVNAAKYCAAQHTPKFLLVSSVGANATSSNFYLRLKGETEAAVLSQSIPSVYIMRPSMLLGSRPQARMGEIIGQPVKRLLSLFFVGGFSKYKAIHANDVAEAMLIASKQTVTGKFICEYREMRKLF